MTKESFQGLSSWQGAKEFAVLSTRLTDSGEPLGEEARGIANHILANTAMMKLAHALPGEVPFLADIWSRPEHRNADIAQDTYAAYMRYGSVCTSTRIGRWSILNSASIQTVYCGLIAGADHGELTG